MARAGEEKVKIVELLKGSPRDLTALVVSSRIADCFVSFTVQPFPKFDLLQNLLPPNNIVNSAAIIPGLVGNQFPVPTGSKGRLTKLDGTSVESLVPVKPAVLYIHNCVVQGSIHTEATLERILAQMYCNKKMSKSGMKQDPKDINVFMESRQVNIKVHNAWRQISSTATCSLKPPNNNGLFDSDAIITLKDYIPNPLCALLFELEFKASIQGFEAKTMKLGFAVAMPELNSIN